MMEANIAEKISERGVDKFVEIEKSCIFSPFKILKLNSKVAMTLQSSVHTDNYLHSGSYGGVLCPASVPI